MRISPIEIRPLTENTCALTNSGKLSLFFIGAGSAFSKRQNQNNLLLVKGRDHLLIDCGTKCPQGLYTVGIKTSDIHNLLITHSHADHIGGLEEIALIGRYVVQRKPNIIITEVYQNILWSMSLRGGIAYGETDPEHPLDFQDIFNVMRPKVLKKFQRETFAIKLGSIKIKMMRTKHIPDNASSWKDSFWSYGVIIDDRILFTSDTRYDPELIYDYDKRFQFEAIFHDCQFFTGGVHASLDELNQLPAHIKKRMYLMHYGDNWEDFEEKVREYGFADLARQYTYYNFK